MSDAKSISDEQKAIIQSWADDGNDLSMIQKKLADELNVNVTFMEVRFLMGDLGIKMPAKEKPVEEEAVDVSEPTEELAAEADTPAAEETTAEEASPPAAIGTVKVTMSDVLPAGVMAGGTVTFSDGVHTNWGLDQMGRMSLIGADPGYRPSEADLKAFQVELQKLAQEKGL
jgi:hypothetical protein